MPRISRASAHTRESASPGPPLLVPSIGTGLLFLSSRRSFLSESDDAGSVSQSDMTAASFWNLVSLWPVHVIRNSGWWNSRRKPCSSRT
jgi:hypothetical protein